MYSNGSHKIVPFMKKMWNITVEPGRPQIIIGTWALHAGYLRLHKHTIRISNTYCFSTETMDRRIRPQCYVYIYIYIYIYIACLAFIFIPPSFSTTTTEINLVYTYISVVWMRKYAFCHTVSFYFIWSLPWLAMTSLNSIKNLVLAMITDFVLSVLETEFL